jgi:predicted transcriptional regulator
MAAPSTAVLEVQQLAYASPLVPRAPSSESMRGPEAPVRDRLLRLVNDRPGLNKSALCAHLGVAWGTVAYHTRILSAAGLLDSEAHGREVFLFPPSLDGGVRRRVRALRMPESDRVLQALSSVREASLLELSRLAGLSRKVVRRRLQELMDAGLVQDKGTRRSRYAATRPGAPPFGARPPEASLGLVPQR